MSHFSMLMSMTRYGRAIPTGFGRGRHVCLFFFFFYTPDKRICVVGFSIRLVEKFVVSPMHCFCESPGFMFCGFQRIAG